ncbi:kinase-like domain-containing protein [Sordaria brevicollis]|uniref:non-specific serine/threonine protein kinase n=1 Tax=Sordaria brevicollis TaxID=83679 RepID=A0AAE0PK80_SORBR|nr:kinase-like domain-containing protein [Sordaria brevicollis]
MESFLEEPLEGWRIGSASDKHRPDEVTRVHTLPEGVDEVWQPINVLGKGAFGEVWEEKCQRGPQKDELRAVKIISKTNAGFSRSSQRELQALDAFSAKHNESQSIDGKAPFPERESSRIAWQVTIGLNYMHKKGFLHRDLKPQNILVHTPGPDWKVKIADFGIAKHIAGPSLYTEYMGSYGYIAPELFDTADEYTEAADIWALGAVVFTMCTGAPPFEQPKYLLEYRAGMRGFPSQVLGLTTGFCIDFILGAMHANPRSRLRIQDLLGHEWLSKDKSLERMMSNG